MMMRKGLWSPDEDERLVRCITKYVNGSWSDIARKAGLDRCGKSCRRRWMNHLRPDLKRGKFSIEEINLIVQLQEALGNRWSDIASHLDGRTDNDVKNLWNTQIKKRLSQIKANQSSNSSTASCVPMITFSDTNNNNNNNNNTHAAVSYNSCTNSSIHQQLKVINNYTNDPANLEFLHSFDDLQAHGNLAVRFNGSINGIDHNSCSASSCEGSDHQDILNPPAHSPDSIHLFWSNIQEHDHPNAAAQFAPNTELTTRADHSLLNMSCHSSNNLASMMIPSLQSPAQVPCPLLCASDHQTAAAATTDPAPCTGILFDLYQENHGDCTTTMASLESSSYVVQVKADSCVGAAINDDSEECCSLQHQCLMGSMDHASSLHDQMVTKTDQSLQQHNFYCSPNMNEVEPVAVVMNNTVYKDADNSDVITGKEAAAAKLVPAGGTNDDDQSSMWEGPNNDELRPQLQSSTNMQVQQASADVNNYIGWDMTTSDQCSGLPHFSFPDWCKHLLQSEYLL